jgi:ADP-heptose:LPS heptosyltransferase
MKTYNRFVFFSAGPVGDHAIFVDYAIRFFESTGVQSTLILKHYYPFLSPVTLPYPYITNIEWESVKGKFQLAWLAVSSIWQKNCYVLVLPLPHPFYMKVFAWFIRFCTRSRIVGLDLKGPETLNFKEKGSAEFLGKKNIIPSNLDKELFYEQANRLLEWLGFKPVAHTPTLRYVDDANILAKHGLREKNYLVIHIMSSCADRSLPVDRWQHVIREIMHKMHGGVIALSGSKGDDEFIQQCIKGLPQDKLVNLAGKVNMQELINIYAKAKSILTVHTGNAIIINMLHVPTVNLTLKGVYMFNYKFNEKAIVLSSEEGCHCNPYERDDTMLMYKGQPYYPCMFNVKDEEVIDAVITQYNA